MNCGPRSVQWLESQYHDDLTLTEARELCGTSKKGSYFPDMASGLTQLGYRNVRIRDNLTYPMLKRLLPANWVLVAWWTHLDKGAIVDDPDEWGGHWSVVLDVTAKDVKLYDPDVDAIISVDKAVFDLHWRDNEFDSHGRKIVFKHAAVVAGKGRQEKG